MRIAFGRWPSTAAQPGEQWQHNNRVLLASNALNEFGSAFAVPFFPLYLRELGIREVGAVALWSGVLYSAIILATALTVPFWAALADRFGHKLVLARAFLGLTVASLLTTQVSTFPQLLAVWAATSFFTGAFPLSYAIATVSTPRPRLGPAIAMLQSMQILAMALGPLLGGSVVDRVGVRPCFYGTLGFSLLALVVLLAFYREPARRASVKASLPAQKAAHGWPIWQSLLPLMALLFLVQLVERSLHPVVPLYVVELKTPATAVGLMAGLVISLGNGAIAFSANLCARLARSYPPQRLLLTCLLASALICLPMAGLREAWQFVLLRVLLGLAAGGVIPLVYVLAGGQVLAGGRTAAAGIFTSSLYYGGAAGPMLGGAVARLSLRSVFVADALIYGVALLVALALVAGSKNKLGTADTLPAQT